MHGHNSYTSSKRIWPSLFIQLTLLLHHFWLCKSISSTSAVLSCFCDDLLRTDSVRVKHYDVRLNSKFRDIAIFEVTDLQTIRHAYRIAILTIYVLKLKFLAPMVH
jgi:hypothetical protein